MKKFVSGLFWKSLKGKRLGVFLVTVLLPNTCETGEIGSQEETARIRNGKAELHITKSGKITVYDWKRRNLPIDVIIMDFSIG